MKKTRYAMPIILSLFALASCSLTTTGGSKSSSASGAGSSSSDSVGSKISASDGDLAATVSASKYNYEELSFSNDTPTFPSTGNQNILVLPITVKGYEKNATEATRSNIEKTLFGEASETGWQSLSSFYSDSAMASSISAARSPRGMPVA